MPTPKAQPTSSQHATTFVRGDEPYWVYGCGCKASALRIQHCPTHAAAEETVRALKAILQWPNPTTHKGMTTQIPEEAGTMTSRISSTPPYPLTLEQGNCVGCNHYPVTLTRVYGPDVFCYRCERCIGGMPSLPPTETQALPGKTYSIIETQLGRQAVALLREISEAQGVDPDRCARWSRMARMLVRRLEQTERGED